MLSKFHKYSQGFLARLKWYYLDSLKGRLIALSLGLSLTLLWALVFFSTAVQQQKFSEELFDQQFASARRLAADLDYKLEARINLLTATARGIPDALSSSILEAHLAQETVLHRIFPAGISLIGRDGRVLADYPVMKSRSGIYVGDRGYFKNVIQTGKPHIGNPQIGRILKRPVLVIAVPVFERTGNVRAVLAGVIDLTASNFLGAYFDKGIASHQRFLIVSPRDNLILAATDSARVMAAAPKTGIVPLYDRFVAGFQGSGMATGADGTMRLYSASYVPTTNWLVSVSLPAEVAFGPVRVIRHYLIGMAAIMTLVAVFLAHWIARRMLVPLDEAGQTIQRMRQGEIPLAPLPVKGKDEVGSIINNFNALVEDRHRSEDALARSEQRILALLENAPEAIFVHTRDCFVYVNAATLHLFGADSQDQLLGKSILTRVRADLHAVVTERIDLIIEAKENLVPMEQKLSRMDGSAVFARISAMPFNYQNKEGCLVFARNITERKLAENALRESKERIQELAAHQETIKENERKRIARDLHDELGQTLLAIRLDAATLAEKTVNSHPDHHKTARLMLNHIDMAMKSVKAVINDLRPFVLDLGLMAALEWQVNEFQRRSGIECVLDVDDEEVDCQLDEARSTALFRVLQESLTNIARHASASLVRIALCAEAGQLLMTIADDGIGIAQNHRQKKRAFGLVGIDERIKAIGGTFAVDSAPGKGVTLRLAIPLAAPIEAPC